jgi:hypothetical protein
MQNVHAVFKPKYHVLSNGALGFPVSPISWTGKWIKLFTETFFSIQSAFLAYRTQLTGKSSEPFERA